MASAWARSSRSLRNARSENSPGRARRAPASTSRVMIISRTTGEAVGLEFDDIFTGEGGRAGKSQNQCAVDDRAVVVFDIAKTGLARSGPKPGQRFGQIKTGRSGKTNDADTGHAREAWQSRRWWRWSCRLTCWLLRFPGRGGAGCTTAGPAITPALVAQYSTSPAGNRANMNANTTGRYIMILRCIGSMPAVGISRWVNDHEDAVEDRQDEVRIRPTQVRYPQKGGLAQFHRFKQYPVQRDENRGSGPGSADSRRAD